MTKQIPRRYWPIIGLLGLGLILHGVALGYPDEVVFDEVHFGKFVTSYCCSGERFFDIHPPHAKLLVASVAYATGYRGGQAFDQIGEEYTAASPWNLRLVPALSGMVLPVVFFAVLLLLGTETRAAWFGGLVLLLDNALTVQTRVISLDGMLLLTIFGSLAAGLKIKKIIESAGRTWLRWSILTGVLLGLAAGIKFTGLAALGLLAGLWLYQVARSKGRYVLTWLMIGAITVLVAVLVYAAGFALHFSLLTAPGPGDAWRVPSFTSPVLVSFVRETHELHKLMLDANYNLTAAHPDASAWWEWPLMRTSVFYWQASSQVGKVGTIYLLGNPVVWWGSTLGLLAILFAECYLWLERKGVLGSKVVSPRVNYKSQTSLWIPVAGYLISYLPLLRVPRALFLYHYFTPLLFAWLIIIVWLDRRGFFAAASPGRIPKRVWLAASVFVIFFLIFSPLTFGYTLPATWHAWLFWLETWR